MIEEVRCDELMLEIHTFDDDLLKSIFGRVDVKAEDAVQEAGFVLTYKRTFARKVAHFPKIVHFVLLIRNERGAEEAAAFLISNLKQKQVEKIVVCSREVAFDRASLFKSFNQS